MIISTLRLGSTNTDLPTGLTGMLTHWRLDMDKSIRYLLQPKGLNPKTQTPLPAMGCEEVRLQDKSDREDIDVPFEILGTQVTDDASGYSGTAIAFMRHINGCFHVVIQAPGTSQKTGGKIDAHEFDLRRCSGPAIKRLSPAELKTSIQERPSPAPGTFDERI